MSALSRQFSRLVKDTSTYRWNGEHSSESVHFPLSKTVQRTAQRTTHTCCFFHEVLARLVLAKLEVCSFRSGAGARNSEMRPTLRLASLVQDSTLIFMLHEQCPSRLNGWYSCLNSKDTMSSTSLQDSRSLKSILKQSANSAATPSPPAAISREDRNRETALYHARLIQHRKDVEQLILTSTETLLDLPSNPASDPAHPSPAEATQVKELLKPFQTSDYDSLIEERNIDGRCGYVLCPRPHTRENTNARFRILQGKGKGPDALKVVRTEKLEQWCSEECAKRALYIRVQLSEVPAWTRAASVSGDIELRGEKHGVAEDTATLVEDIRRLGLDGNQDGLTDAIKDLALERGERRLPSQTTGLVDVRIRENDPIEGRLPRPPDISAAQGGRAEPGYSVEGYTPRTSGSRMQRRHWEDEDEESYDYNDMMRTI